MKFDIYFRSYFFLGRVQNAESLQCMRRDFCVSIIIRKAANVNPCIEKLSSKCCSNCADLVVEPTGLFFFVCALARALNDTQTWHYSRKLFAFNDFSIAQYITYQNAWKLCNTAVAFGLCECKRYIFHSDSILKHKKVTMLRTIPSWM